MRTNYKLGVIALTLLLPVVGCDSNETIDVPIATYVATLTTVNPLLGNVTGTAAVEIVGDAMRVTIHAVGLDSIAHMQFIASGHSCPTAAQDVNADGLIDVQEGLAAYGPFLIALDTALAVRPIDDVNTAGFPAGTTINYTEDAQLSAVENSLRGAPTTPPFTTNLPTNGDFNPEGLAVVIMGDAFLFPQPLDSVWPGFTAKQSTPVACGVLHLVTS